MENRKTAGRGVSGRGGVERWLYRLLLVAAAMFMLYQVGKSIYNTNQKLTIYEQAQADVQQLRVENLRVLLEKDHVITEDYIETQKRDRLNLVKEGEVVFIIPDEVLNSPVVDQYLESIRDGGVGGVVTDDTPLESWIRFFRSGV